MYEWLECRVQEGIGSFDSDIEIEPVVKGSSCRGTVDTALLEPRVYGVYSILLRSGKGLDLPKALTFEYV